MVNSSGEHTLSAGNSSVKLAEGNAVISCVAVLVQPKSSVAVNVTMYVDSVPSASKEAVALVVVVDAPLPKSHVYASAWVLVLLNATFSGAHPLSTEAVKSA